VTIIYHSYVCYELFLFLLDMRSSTYLSKSCIFCKWN